MMFSPLASSRTPIEEEQVTTEGRSRPVRGSSAPQGQRLASTVRLPWLVGLASLLTLSAVLGLLSGRDSSTAGVQRAALDAQEATAVGAAQQVRRSLNEGSDDLVQVARTLSPYVEGDQVPSELARTVLEATAEWHLRYLSLSLVDAATGRNVLGVPGETAPAPLGELPDDRRQVVVLDDGRIVQSVPVRDDSGLLVAAVHDPAFLYPNLFPRPGALYVVADDGRILAAPGAVGLGEALPTPLLRETAEVADGVSGATARPAGPGLSSVTAHAPVDGVGPGGDAGLGVVLVRDVATSGAPVSYRVTGALAALAVGLTSIALFRWLHVAVVRPVLDLQLAAERVAYGDLSRPVEVTRYDEVGTTARALERLRLALIRAEVQDLHPTTTDATSRRTT